LARRKPPRVDRSRVRTVPVRRRSSKVQRRDEGHPHRAGSSFATFLDSLPAILGARDLRDAIDAGARARRRGRPLLWGLGAHVIKVGLAPLVVDLIEREFVSGVLLTGAERLNAAIRTGAEQKLGMGTAVGREIEDGPYPHKSRSILAAALRHDVPVTVHAAIGTDIHHMHPSADGAAIGATSHRDFETLTGLVAGLDGGVYWNVGSAVILPEVFLKALALARNLGHPVRRVTTVNLDFVRQYRPEVNVVERPTRLGGRGISLVGHHEILVPLIAAGLVEAHAAGRAGS
jgi:hypothetical protein